LVAAYSSRLEHVDDLRALLDQSGLPLDDLMENVRGIAKGKDVRRLTDLVRPIENGGAHE
jgi:hypothetical protein